MSTPEVKEWIRASHSANGQTSVTVTLQSGTFTVKWAVKTYVDYIADGVDEARRYATRALEQLQLAARR